MPCQPSSSQHSATPLVIAIDGPAASGKSTVGHELAKRLGFLFSDTGAMYRAVTLAALRRQIPIDDELRVSQLAADLLIQVLNSPQGGYTVLIDDEDVTGDLRSAEVDAHVSIVSTYVGVRTALTQQQRRIASQGRVVMVGRDIGTIVYPEAPLKVYLDATAEERARRRYLEKIKRGQSADYEFILQGVRQRDRIDSQRATAPLRIASDAVVIQTDDLSQEEVVDAVMKLVHQRLQI